MSARGLGTAINPFGNYPTPPHLFLRFAEALRAAGETWLDDAENIEEPCAGEGVLVGAIRTACPKARIYASDIRDGLKEQQMAAGASHAYTMCALHVAQYPYDGSERNAVVTNPDFDLFADLLATHRRYRDEVPIALLGRGSLFCGAQDRAELLTTCGAPDVFMVPERPSFLRFRWVDEYGRKLDAGGSDRRFDGVERGGSAAATGAVCVMGGQGMLYEDILRGFAEAAMPLVDWETAEWTDTGDDEARAARAMQIAVAMEAAFSATLKTRRDAAEQAAKKAREDAARAETAAPAEPLSVVCDWTAYGMPCGRPAAATRVQRGLTRERPMCAAHESAGEALDYWLPKAAP